MSERLADVSARIDGIRQLGAVVNAMKGIAAARANSARSAMVAVDSYAATIAAAISDALGPSGPPPLSGVSTEKSHGTGLLVFCAEQGFAGAFSERILNSVQDDLSKAPLFLVGTQGLSVATSRGLRPVWTVQMSSHTPGIPKLADRIVNEIYRAIGAGQFERLEMIHATWGAGQGQVVRRTIWPIDLTDLPKPGPTSPLTQLPKEALINDLSGDYMHSMVCKAALLAFAAENEARIEAMTAAGSQIKRELEEFEARLRRVRQEAITAEIIELGTGAVAAQAPTRHS